jgi:hypothetical protein
MNRPVRNAAVLLSLLLWVPVLAADEGKRKKGILGGLGGLGGPGEGPRRDDSAETPPADGPRAGGRPEGRPGRPAGGPGKQDEDDINTLRLKSRIEVLEHVIREAEERKRPESIDSMKDAERRVKWLESQLDKMKKDLDMADRDAARKTREEEDAFRAKWKNVMEAIEKGEPPAGMSPAEWARALDEFYREKAALDAAKMDRRRRIEERRRKQLAAQENLVQKARDVLQDLKRTGKRDDPVTRLRKQLLEKRAHDAQLALWRKKLAEYKALLAESRGKKGGRHDPLMEDVFKGTGFWYVDVMRREFRKVWLDSHKMPPSDKALGLSLPEGGASEGKTGEPASGGKGEANGGLSLPDWMKDRPPKPGKPDKGQKGLKDEDFKRARQKALARQLEHLRQQLQSLEKDIAAEDADEIARLERAVEKAKQFRDPELRKKHVTRHQERLRKRREELERTRKARTEKRRKGLQDLVDHIKKKIVKASAG